MINYETILSTFDDKLTLLQWLQKVEEALQGAGLERVDITQITPTTAVFKFTFADGTSLTTPSITLPRGPKGDTGATGATGATGNGIASITKTGTSGLIDTYTVLYTNGSTDTFTVTNGAQGEAGQDGTDGTDGVGISNVAINNSGALIVTLTSGSDINAGQVYEILNLTGTSGTLTSAQLDLAKHENTLIHISGKDYLLQYVSGGAVKLTYKGTSADISTLDIETAEVEITVSTGAWVLNTGAIPYVIDVADRIDTTGATQGQVLTVGTLGAEWADASGGGKYLHNLRIWRNGIGTGVEFEATAIIVNDSSTKIETGSGLRSALRGAGFDTYQHYTIASGLTYDHTTSKHYIIVGLYGETSTNITFWSVAEDSTSAYGEAQTVTQASIGVSDIVTTL